MSYQVCKFPLADEVVLMVIPPSPKIPVAIWNDKSFKTRGILKCNHPFVLFFFSASFWEFETYAEKRGGILISYRHESQKTDPVDICTYKPIPSLKRWRAPKGFRIVFQLINFQMLFLLVSGRTFWRTSSFLKAVYCICFFAATHKLS